MIQFQYDGNINDQIIKALTKQFHKKIRNHISELEEHIKKSIRNVFTMSSEYKLLTSGHLMAHFGLEKDSAMEIVDKIISTLGEQIHIEYDNLISIYAVKSNFEDLLSLSEASYMSNEYHIPWLNWFLTQGDRILVTDYHIKLGLSKKQARHSRSGLAIMINGGSWGGKDWKDKMPIKYAGTPNDNWITSVCAAFQGAFKIVIKKKLEEILNV